MFLGLVKADKSEPKIVTLDAPIKMAGVSIRTGMKKIYKDSVTIGKVYRRIKGTITNKREPWAFTAISKNISPDNSEWDYLMGDVVTSFDTQPENLETFEIPVKTYAVFKVAPKFGFLWGPAIGKTKKFIFNDWLPNSGYEADTGEVGDFEYHDERSVGRNPSIDLYVPVRKKE